MNARRQHPFLNHGCVSNVLIVITTRTLIRKSIPPTHNNTGEKAHKEQQWGDPGAHNNNIHKQSQKINPIHKKSQTKNLIHKKSHKITKNKSYSQKITSNHKK